MALSVYYCVCLPRVLVLVKNGVDQSELERLFGREEAVLGEEVFPEFEGLLVGAPLEDGDPGGGVALELVGEVANVPAFDGGLFAGEGVGEEAGVWVGGAELASLEKVDGGRGAVAVGARLDVVQGLQDSKDTEGGVGEASARVDQEEELVSRLRFVRRYQKVRHRWLVDLAAENPQQPGGAKVAR